MNKIIASISLAALLASCATQTSSESIVDENSLAAAAEQAASPAPVKDRQVVTSSPADFGTFGLDLNGMDPSVQPGDDFFSYVNGKWVSEFEMPADRSRYGAFSLLAEMSEQRVRFIIEDLAAEAPSRETLEGKIAAYFNAYMNQAGIEAAGLAPIEPLLADIREVSNRAELVELFASTGFSSPFVGWVDVDSKSTDNYIFYFRQGGLGLGDRNYYLIDDDKNFGIRKAYKELLATLLSKAGYDDAESMAEKVYGLETEIARAHWDRAVGRNRNLTYNKVSKTELIEIAGAFPAEVLLNGLGIADQDAFILSQITPTSDEIIENGLNEEQVDKVSGGGLPRLMEIASTHDLEVWKAWLSARLLSDFADILPKEIDDANFAFYGKVLGGREEQRERWKRGVASVEDALGEGVGKVYAGRYFPTEAKSEMEKLVANLRLAMAANLDDITWMSDDTKVEARAKLAKFTPKIGYTEKFETYDGMEIIAEMGPVANRLASDEWAWNDMVSQLGTPIDKTQWFMLPQTVNAYYSPNRNEIVFPAAILQPPFFNMSADPAINYGAIGAVIGHEIGHGFDDQGAKSDGNGVLRNWWTDEDQANFRALTSALVEQYNGFCPLDDGKTCVNGQLSLGENIGDVGGLSMAYRAYQLSLNGEEAPVIDGLTGDQRFFMSWAQVWRNKSREEQLRRQLVTGPHSPPEFRVNGVVRNFDAWYEAFNVTEDNALYLPPEKRIKIW